MSLLKKASIITTPTAYAEDYLYSIKPAFALGSSLTSSPVNLSNDFNANGSSSITDADTFTSTGGSLDGITSKTSVYTLTVGRRFQIEIQGNTTSSGFTLGAGNGNGDEYGSGFGVHTFVSLHAQLWIRQRTSGTTNITKLSIQEVTDADFHFDRNSTGTRLNEDYLIEDVPYNFVINSEDFSQSTWLKSNVTITSNSIIAPDGTLSGGKILETTGSSNGHFILDSLSLAENITYNFSAFVKKLNRRYVALQNSYNSNNGSIAFFDLDNKTIIYTFSNGDGGRVFSVSDAKIESAANGWVRLSANFQSNVAGDSLVPSLVIADSQWSTGFSYNNTYAGDVTKGVYAWGLQIVKGDQPKDYLKTTDRLDIPRIDYTNGEGSILLEPQRQNRLDYSQDLSQWGNKSDTSVSASTELSPEGIANAYLLENTGSPSAFLANNTLTVTIGTTYTFSFFVKKVNNTWVRIGHVSSATTGCWFDLDNGVVGTVNSTSATIEKYPNNWFRITNTFVATAGAGTAVAFIGISQVDGSTDAETGKQLLIYGAQVEEGSYATSLIHTSGSAVTRSADSANNAGNSDLINSTEGVLYAEMKALADDATNRRISISDGTTANRMYISYKNFTNQIRAEVISSSSSVFDATYSANDITIFSKIALKYKLNDFSLYIDGVEVANDTSGAVPTGLKELAFDDGAGNNDFYGNVKSLMVFKEALTDLELEKLTGYNNHELYMNYYNRLSYLGLVEEYNVESDINNYIL